MLNSDEVIETGIDLERLNSSPSNNLENFSITTKATIDSFFLSIASYQVKWLIECIDQINERALTNALKDKNWTMETCPPSIKKNA